MTDETTFIEKGEANREEDADSARAATQKVVVSAGSGQDEKGDDEVGLRSTVLYQSITPIVSDRYSPIRFHARGGVGEVWLAEDAEIGRQVALKRLLRNKEGTQERFMAEAQIAGQLEHPSIVPVHDLGMDKAGRPYYVMQFVHGRTLRDEIEDYHSSKEPDHVRAVQQQRLLDHFVDMCEAIAFAHTRGVIHRDLKPSNVMLGLFGETIVLDWGLAKVLHQPEIPGMATAVTSSGRSSETAYGSVIGTPSYMPPEIAEGKAHEAGPPTDIYLLGATLYEILTASPPRRGGSHDEIMELARTVPPIPPRELNKQVPRPLEAICMRAMAKRENDRYESAMQIADDVRRYLAGEAVTTYDEPISDRFFRWARKHRRGIARVATAALFGFVLLGAWGAIAKVRERSAERERLAQQSQREAEQLAAIKQAEAERLHAIDVAQQQLARFREAYDEAFFLIGDETDGEQFTYFQVDNGLRRIEDALALADPWLENIQSLLLEAERGNVKRELYELLVLRAHASLRAGAPEPESALRDLEQAEALGVPVTRALYLGRADALGKLGETEAADLSNQLADEARVAAFDHFLRAERLRSYSLFEESRSRQLDDAIEAYNDALDEDPDHYWSRLQLGRAYLAQGRLGQSIQALGGCEALRPTALWASTAKGIAYARDGQYQKALKTLDRVLSKKPSFRPALLNRGWVHWKLNHLKEATSDFSAVLQPPNDKQLVLAHFYLGMMQLEGGNLQQALNHFEDFAAHEDQQPAFWVAHKQLAMVHFLLGQQQSGMRHLDLHLQQSSPLLTPAETFFERGKFLRTLYSRHWRPLNDRAKEAGNQAKLQQLAAARKVIITTAMRELTIARQRLGTADVFYELGLIVGYGGNKKTALEVLTLGIEKAPKSFKLRNRRGYAYYQLDMHDQALNDYQQATGLEPKTEDDAILLAEAHSWVAAYLTLKDQSEEALKHVTRSLSLMLGMTRRHDETFWVFHNLACVYGGLASQGGDEAEEWQDRSIEMLKQSLREAERVDEAAVERSNIRQEREEFFNAELKARPEFQALLADTTQ